MNKRIYCLYVRLFLVVLVGVTGYAQGQTIEHLYDSEQLSVTVTLVENKSDNATEFIIAQPITVTVEVLTSSWFAKGSRIEPFELADTVIPPTSDLAINGSELVKGRTWVSQLREIIFYPTKAKNYRFPSLDVFVSIKTEAGVVEGVVQTKPFSFDVGMPAALKGKADFVVSSEFTLDITSDFDEAKNYVVGDAITETVLLEADGFPAMMIPVVKFDEVDGMSTYHKPPHISDVHSRRGTKGQRIEEFTYIFEQAGVYTLPAQVYYWWDLNDDELIEVILPARIFKVNRAQVSVFYDFKKALLAGNFNLKVVFLGLVILGVTIFIVRLLWRYRTKIVRGFLSNRFYNAYKSRVKKQFIKALESGEYTSAYNLLYQYYDLPHGDVCALEALINNQKILSSVVGPAVVFQRLREKAFAAEICSHNDAQLNQQDAMSLLNCKVVVTKRAASSVINHEPLF